MNKTEVKDAIKAECDALCKFLWDKNEAYGNSALEPIRCFSKADTIEQINVRADDKLSRIMRGEAAGEDAELDLMGYLLLKRVAVRLFCEGLSSAAQKGVEAGLKLREHLVESQSIGVTASDKTERCSGCRYFQVKEFNIGMSGKHHRALCLQVFRGLAGVGESFFSEKEINEIVKPDWCPGKKYGDENEKT